MQLIQRQAEALELANREVDHQYVCILYKRQQDFTTFVHRDIQSQTTLVAPGELPGMVDCEIAGDGTKTIASQRFHLYNIGAVIRHNRGRTRASYEGSGVYDPDACEYAQLRLII